MDRDKEIKNNIIRFSMETLDQLLDAGGYMEEEKSKAMYEVCCSMAALSIISGIKSHQWMKAADNVRELLLKLNGDPAKLKMILDPCDEEKID